MAYVTLDEIAAELRISPDTARRAVISGRIKAIQVNGPGSMWRIDRRDFREYLTKARKSADAAECAAEGNSDDMVKTG